MSDTDEEDLHDDEVVSADEMDCEGGYEVGCEDAYEDDDMAAADYAFDHTHTMEVRPYMTEYWDQARLSTDRFPKPCSVVWLCPRHGVVSKCACPAMPASLCSMMHSCRAVCQEVLQPVTC
jgi:hypothetical protein